MLLVGLTRVFGMLKKILLVLLVAIVALLGYAWTRPDTYTVTRSAVVPAPPERVFALIDDFHHWAEWSPWQKLDPAMRATYSGPASGVGAVYAWEGNKQVGKGRMEITESMPPRKVGIKLDFIDRARAISTICCSATERSRTSVVGRSPKPSRSVS